VYWSDTGEASSALSCEVCAWEVERLDALVAELADELLVVPGQLTDRGIGRELIDQRRGTRQRRARHPRVEHGELVRLVDGEHVGDVDATVDQRVRQLRVAGDALAVRRVDSDLAVRECLEVLDEGRRAVGIDALRGLRRGLVRDRDGVDVRERRLDLLVRGPEGIALA
jgi:hypothetical protein